MPYGNTEIEIQIPFAQYDIFLPKKIKPSIDQIQLVNNSFYSCSDPEINQKDWSNKKIGIGINDQTRPLPNEILIPALLNFLKNKQVLLENITFFIATGTHKPLKSELFSLILDEKTIKGYKVLSHDCDDERNLVYLGDSSSGTPVYLNKAFYESEIRILVGNIEPHHFMGYSGGLKTASIGLTGRKTITANHSMLTHPNSIMGLFHSNPMRQDVERIGRMIGIDAALNVIINDEREIISSYWGKAESVIKQGIEFIKQNVQMDLKQNQSKYDLVIASPGGYPKDINFYQSQKAITHASYFSKQGGIIILAAECRDGLGSGKFQSFIESRATFEAVIDDFEALPFEIGPHKAYQLAKQAINHKIFLISHLEKTLIEKIHLIPADNFEHAFMIADQYLDKKTINIAVLPYATHILPKFEDVNNNS